MSLLSLHLWMDTSSCFLVLVMVNSAAVNMGCRYLFEVFNFSRYLSKSEITVVLGGKQKTKKKQKQNKL